MRRIGFLQQSLTLSDPGVEETHSDVVAMARFDRFDLGAAMPAIGRQAATQPLRATVLTLSRCTSFA